MSSLDDVVTQLSLQPVLDQTQQETALAALLSKLEDLRTQLEGYLADGITAEVFSLRWRGVVLEGGVACPAEALTFDIKLQNGILILFDPILYGENLRVNIRLRTTKAFLYLDSGDWWAHHTGGPSLLTEEVLGDILQEMLIDVDAL